MTNSDCCGQDCWIDPNGDGGGRCWPLTKGDSCSSDGDCFGAACINGVCAGIQTPMRCYRSSDCISGVCRDGGAFDEYGYDAGPYLSWFDAYHGECASPNGDQCDDCSSYPGACSSGALGYVGACSPLGCCQ